MIEEITTKIDSYIEGRKKLRKIQRNTTLIKYEKI
jgi:hypothetical protein